MPKTLSINLCISCSHYSPWNVASLTHAPHPLLPFIFEKRSLLGMLSNSSWNIHLVHTLRLCAWSMLPQALKQQISFMEGAIGNFIPTRSFLISSSKPLFSYLRQEFQVLIDLHQSLFQSGTLHNGPLESQSPNDLYHESLLCGVRV